MKSLHLLQGDYWHSQRAFASAQQLIVCKIQNQRHVLMERGARHRDAIAHVFAEIEQCEQLLKKASRRQSIFLLEARATSSYQKALQIMGYSPPSWRRIRHGEDRWNRALDIGSHWLAAQVRTYLDDAGFTGEIGVLHAPRAGSDALVYDLMELVRQPVMEWVVLVKHAKEIRSTGALCAALKRRLDESLPCEALSFSSSLLQEIQRFTHALNHDEVWLPRKLSWAHRKK